MEAGLMKNKLYGNMILCKELSDDLEYMERPFDYLQINSENKMAKFELIVFLNCLPETNEEVNLMITLSPANQTAFRMLGFKTIILEKNNGFIEATTIDSGDIDFEQEGIYHVDLRASKVNIRKDSSHADLLKIFSDSEIINRISFIIEFI